MAVTITKKLPLPQNALDHTPSTNKGEVIDIKLSDVCYPSILNIKDIYDTANVIVLKPRLDWLEFTCPVDKKHETEIEKGLNSLAYADTEDFVSLSPIAQKKANQAKKGTGYKRRFYWLNGQKLTDQIMVAYAPKDTKKAFIKIILQPSGLSAKDIAAFRQFWDALAINHPYLKLDNVFAQTGTIKRMDIATDILNVTVSNLYIQRLSATKSTKKQVMHVYKDLTGYVETIYLSHTVKTPAKDYVYDKKLQLESDEQDYPYGSIPMARFERRVETEKAINNLGTIKNYFSDYSVKFFDHNTLEKKAYKYKLFANYALARTPEKALELIPEKHQHFFEKAFQEGLNDIWQPELLHKGLLQDFVRLGLIEKPIPKQKKGT